MRNLLTFFATTLFTLHNHYYKDEIEYTNDNRVYQKLNILNLEVIMTHQLPFNYFSQFVRDHAKESLVYLNLYCLIELYRKKLSGLLIHANKFKKQMLEEGENFDSREISELRTQQMIIGRNMMNILEYISQQ
jgi:hypothetical protein